jgi:Fe2+ transport system protein FeoA
MAHWQEKFLLRKSLRWINYKEIKYMIKLLSDFAIGEKGKIVKVNGEGRVRRRLFDMGVTPQAEVAMRKKAPLGDPIEVTIRGYELSLRLDEAKCVEVEVK